MRCFESPDVSGARENAPPDGAPGGPPHAVQRRTAAAMRIRPLAERRTARAVEEVEASRIDRELHLVADPERRMRRELGDEIRLRSADGLLHLALRVRNRLLFAGERHGVDPEVREGAAAERLDELDARVNYREVGTF